MTILTIREIPDPVLRAVAEPVETVDDSVRTLINDMFDTMYAARGIGLAATQVGVTRRVVVIDLQPAESDAEDAPTVREPHAYVNPQVVWESEERSRYSEGCLSIPEQYAEVERAARCRITYLDRDGASQEAELDGLMATCMLHEIDHLNGVLFIDHISRLKREMIVRKVNKARRLG